MNIENILYLLIGFFSCAILFLGFSGTDLELPIDFNENADSFKLNAPSDWVDEEDIILFEDMILLKISGSSISNYAPTGSMRPLFDKGANGIRIIPEFEEDVTIGDIVSFKLGNNLVVHRVIEKGIDEKGVYFITKGDNNNVSDGKIRFKDIEFVTVGVIW
tara:strand:- start:2150 stop:2632 length:483 start_codon:yes stop_codon:yes gene_type:complete